MIAYLIIVGIMVAFVTGVAEANRVINAIHAIENSIHLKIAYADQALHERLSALEEAVKGKL